MPDVGTCSNRWCVSADDATTKVRLLIGWKYQRIRSHFIFFSQQQRNRQQHKIQHNQHKWQHNNQQQNQLQLRHHQQQNQALERRLVVTVIKFDWRDLIQKTWITMEFILKRVKWTTDSQFGNMKIKINGSSSVRFYKNNFNSQATSWEFLSK